MILKWVFFALLAQRATDNLPMQSLNTLPWSSERTVSLITYCPSSPGVHDRDSPFYCSKDFELERVENSTYIKLFHTVASTLYLNNNFRFFMKPEEMVMAKPIADRKRDAFIEESGGNPDLCPAELLLDRRPESAFGERMRAQVLPIEQQGRTIYHAQNQNDLCLQGGCAPEGIMDIHELTHVQQCWYKYRKLGLIVELVPSIKQHIDLYTICEEIREKNIEQEINFGRTISINGIDFQAGSFAIFYRDLENKYPTLLDAVMSPESIEYLTGLNYEFLNAIADQSVLDLVLENAEPLRREITVQKLNLKEISPLTEEKLKIIFNDIESIKYLKKSGAIFKTLSDGLAFLRKVPTSIEIEAVKSLLEQGINIEALLSLNPTALARILQNIDAAIYIMNEYDITIERLSTLDGKPVSPLDNNPDPLPVAVFQYIKAIDYLIKECKISLTKILWLDPRVLEKILPKIQAIQSLHEHGVNIQTLFSPNKSDESPGYFWAKVIDLIEHIDSTIHLIEHHVDIEKLLNANVENLHLLFDHFDNAIYLMKHGVNIAPLLLDMNPDPEFTSLLQNHQDVVYVLENFKSLDPTMVLAHTKYVTLIKELIELFGVKQETISNIQTDLNLFINLLQDQNNALDLLNLGIKLDILISDPRLVNFMCANKEALKYLIQERRISPIAITSALLTERRGEILTYIEVVKYLMEKHDICLERLLNIPRQDLKKLFEGANSSEFELLFNDFLRLEKTKPTKS